MALYKILIIYPHGSGIRRVIGDIVDIAEGFGDDPCHIAGFRQNGKLLEAIQPCVTEDTDPHFYDGCKVRVMYIDVPDVEAAEKEAESLIGVPYGLKTDCLSGLIHSVTGKHAATNGKETVDCSETWTRILRAGGVSFLDDSPADCITPKDFMLALEPIEVKEGI